MIQSLGAKPIHGDINNLEALKDGCKDVNCVFHLAARVQLEGNWDDFQRETVEGTENIVKAAKQQQIKKLVHVSTEAVLIGGPTLKNADETWVTIEIYSSLICSHIHKIL